ncbi:hypothetical protein JBE04_27515 [Streptomyces sp. PRKS01-29]|nr:hypothetical protein [Streptomyces sabulosicollis]MBI0298115.1 hypothetical protein [Streptomyces sabulosicollis]
MKDLVVGVLVGLVILVALWSVLWVMTLSSEAEREKCESEADSYGAHATCIVKTR